MQRSLDDLVANADLSSYREQALEQAFLAELFQAAWVAGYRPLEVDRPSVDAYGYDLVITTGEVLRHVQLKASRKGRISVHRWLAGKPSACVVNMLPTVAPNGRTLHLTYRFFGPEPGKPLVVEGLPPAKKAYHVKQEDGTFIKPDRQRHVTVSHGKFEKPVDIFGLLPSLFGDAPA